MPAGEKARAVGTPAADYVAAQFRRFQVTEKQHCRAAGEMKHLAETYRSVVARQDWDRKFSCVTILMVTVKTVLW